MNFKKSIITAAALVAMGAASFAQATPTFTVDYSSISTAAHYDLKPIGISSAQFQAQSILGSSSELLHRSTDANGVTTDAASGYIDYASFLYADPVTGLTKAPYSVSGFQLYVLFSLKDTVTAAGNVLTSLNFTMYADQGNDNLFTQAGTNLDGTGREAVVTNTAGDIPLASGNLVAGIAYINALNGVGLNANTTFVLSDAGKRFFVQPTPFYNLSFNAFNNPSNTLNFNEDNTLAISDAGGKTTFDNAVPEPTSIALLGLGLLAVGATARRRKS